MTGLSCRLDSRPYKNGVLSNDQTLLCLAPVHDGRVAANEQGAILGLGLANIPVTIVAVAHPAVQRTRFTAGRTALTVAWLAAIVAAITVGATLRTPLTTFQMFSEMLADCLVTTEDQRKQYLLTLKDESKRLSAMVSNVLTHALRGKMSGMSKTTVTMILLLLGLLFVASHGAGDEAPLFDGRWQARYTGSEAGYEMEFSGGRFHAVDGVQWYKGEFVIDAEADPGRIDFVIQECECGHQGKTSKGIFRWDGDVIEIRAPPPDEPRATEFDENSSETMRLVREID